LTNETNIKYEATSRYQFEILLCSQKKTQKTCRRAAVCPTLQFLLHHDQYLINSLWVHKPKNQNYSFNCIYFRL